MADYSNLGLNDKLQAIDSILARKVDIFDPFNFESRLDRGEISAVQTRLNLPNIFGSGDDGNVSISSNTTLARDMYYRNLSIASGFVLTTAGYRIFVRETFTNNGTVRSNGNNASGATAGTGASGNVMQGGGTGGAGISTAGNGNVSATLRLTIGGDGGSGGNAGANTGGASGGVTWSTDIASGLQDLFTGLTGYLLEEGVFRLAAGSAGGGGGANTEAVATSGGGGGGGGLIMISARNLNNSGGTIETIGGNGGNASGGTTAKGGGGGGGGGAIILVYLTYRSGTNTVTGGTGGTGINGGASGTDGSIGRIITIPSIISTI